MIYTRFTLYCTILEIILFYLTDEVFALFFLVKLYLILGVKKTSTHIFITTSFHFMNLKMFSTYKHIYLCILYSNSISVFRIFMIYCFGGFSESELCRCCYSCYCCWWWLLSSFIHVRLYNCLFLLLKVCNDKGKCDPQMPSKYRIKSR